MASLVCPNHDIQCIYMYMCICSTQRDCTVNNIIYSSTALIEPVDVRFMKFRTSHAVKTFLYRSRDPQLCSLLSRMKHVKIPAHVLEQDVACKFQDA